MISKNASNRDNCTVGTLFTSSARAAWGHIIRSTLTGPRRKVLLPAYIGFTEREGSGVFDPVRENDCEFAFYKVNADLSVDIEDFKQRVAAGVDIVLVIHYFGFCVSDLALIRAICDDAQAIMVEDCAHAFQLESPDAQLGGVGDVTFYSLHKYIATDDGGMLRINNKELRVLPLPSDILASREVVEQYALTRFDEVKNIRRANFALYEELLAGFEPIHVMYQLRAGDVPQTFPIRVKSGKREALYFYLMERGVPTTALYYRMIDQIDANEFPESFRIAGEILNLPVHQDTTLDDVREVCTRMREFFIAKEN